MEKRLRSNETGAQGCYFIRRLANNLGEPQRSYAINAIDRALTFWKAKRVRKPVPLRATWLLAPNWTRDLRQLLTAHVHRTKCYNTTLQTPSTGIVFTKFPSVMDSLCNHKEAATKWADGEAPKCACGALRQHASHHHQPDQHLVLEGDNLHFDDGPYTSIATGSLQNKIFPPSKEIHASLRLWLCGHGLPGTHSLHYQKHILMRFGTDPFTPTTMLSITTSRTKTSYVSNDSFQMPSFTTKTSELHPCESIARCSTSSASLPPSPTLCVSQIGGKPKRHHREDHRRDQQAIWQVIPMGPWRWP